MQEPLINTVLQYGSFGLLALMVGWTLKIGIPKALEMHQNAIQQMMTTFSKEQGECREERQHVQKEAVAEREKDRQIRHDLANKLQMLVEALSGKVTDGRNGSDPDVKLIPDRPRPPEGK